MQYLQRYCSVDMTNRSYLPRDWADAFSFECGRLLIKDKSLADISIAESLPQLGEATDAIGPASLLFSVLQIRGRSASRCDSHGSVAGLLAPHMSFRPCSSGPYCDYGCRAWSLLRFWVLM
jgi:hypothetical protein